MLSRNSLPGGQAIGNKMTENKEGSVDLDDTRFERMRSFSTGGSSSLSEMRLTDEVLDQLTTG